MKSFCISRSKINYWVFVYCLLAFWRVSVYGQSNALRSFEQTYRKSGPAALTSDNADTLDLQNALSLASELILYSGKKAKSATGYEGYFLSHRSKESVLGLFGSFSNDDRKAGFGTFYYLNGDRYQGYWNYDRKHGYGKLFFSNGDVFEGNWKYDLTSQGTYDFFSLDLTVSGYFNLKADRSIGLFIKRYIDDSYIVFKGQVNRSTFLPNGLGILVLSDETILAAGEWENGCLIKPLDADLAEKKINKLYKKAERQLR